MSKEYLPDKEKRILLSALSHEMKIVKDNNLTELIPVVKNLDYKFMYDRLFKQIENKAYQQGRADAFADCILENGEYCWQECCETEKCKECKWLGNGDTIWFEPMQKGEANE